MIYFKIYSYFYIINTSKINFVVFTVINLTNDYKINNPPNPPYININDLYYYTYINSNSLKIREEIKNIITKTNQYNFYTDILQNTTYDKIVCSYSNNIELNKKLEKYKDFNLKKINNKTITEHNDSIKHKYLKYKQKYLNIKYKNI